MGLEEEMGNLGRCGIPAWRSGCVLLGDESIEICDDLVLGRVLPEVIAAQGPISSHLILLILHFVDFTRPSHASADSDEVTAWL